MTDDEILAIANEVLVPAGLSGAKIYRPPIPPDEASCLAIIVRCPRGGGGADASLMAGWRAYPETIPQAPTPMMIRDAAKQMVLCAIEASATWPTPWVPANQTGS